MQDTSAKSGKRAKGDNDRHGGNMGEGGESATNLTPAVKHVGSRGGGVCGGYGGGDGGAVPRRICRQ